MKKILSTLMLLLISGILWFLQGEYGLEYLTKGFETILALTIIYFLFKVLFEGIIAKKITDGKTRYYFRKSVSLIYLVVFLITIITIWVEKIEALMVAYGLIGAGAAIALQDFFKNIVGGITIFVNRPYSVGDRIEIENKRGDVVDIGLLYTTMMEITEWVAGDQATGRLTTIPNGAILGKVFNNYTKDNDFMWDELFIPVTYGSDWRKAQEIMQRIITDETKGTIDDAHHALSELRSKYYVSKRDIDPSIYLTLTDNWIAFYVRYMAPVKERRPIHNHLHMKILEALEKEESVTVASETMEITVHNR